METFENREKKVLSFMEEVQDELLMKKQDDDFLNSIDYKLKKLDQCNKEGKELCLDTIIRKIYKDCTPLNDDYKVACNDKLDDTFDLFMARKCPKGMEFYVREGLKKNSPFAKKVLEAVENLVNEQTNDMAMNIDNIDGKDLVFASNDDVTKKLDIIGSDLNLPEITQAVQNNVKATAISEINRAKKEKEELKNLENELANDVKVDSQEAIESALEFRDKGVKDYIPTLFEGVMINKMNKVQAQFESGELDQVYLYNALDDYGKTDAVTEEAESTIHFATPEEVAFVEAVQEYSLLSMLKALKLESYSKYDINDLAQEYAQS